MSNCIQAIKGIQPGLKSVQEGRTFLAKEVLTKQKQKIEIASANLILSD